MIQEALDTFKANDPTTLSQYIYNFENQANERLEELKQENSFSATIKNNSGFVILGAVAALAVVGFVLFKRK